jgi:hypothetical protein
MASPGFFIEMRNLVEVDGEASNSNLAIAEINLGAHFPNSFAASASFAVKFRRMPK